MAAMISAHSCEHRLPVWHHHILLITVFSLFFSTPPLHLTWQQMRHLWQRLTRQWPSPTSSGLLSVCSLGGRERKKQMRSEGTKKRRRRDRSVSDNGLGQQNRVRLKVCKNYCSSCTSCLFSSGSWYLSHNSHFDRKLPPFNFRLFKKTFEWDISFSLISFLKNPFSCPTRLFKPSVIRWDPSSKVEAPSPPKFLKLRSFPVVIMN